MFNSILDSSFSKDRALKKSLILSAFLFHHFKNWNKVTTWLYSDLWGLRKEMLNRWQSFINYKCGVSIGIMEKTFSCSKGAFHPFLEAKYLISDGFGTHKVSPWLIVDGKKKKVTALIIKSTKDIKRTRLVSGGFKIWEDPKRWVQLHSAKKKRKHM